MFLSERLRCSLDLVSWGILPPCPDIGTYHSNTSDKIALSIHFLHSHETFNTAAYLSPCSAPFWPGANRRAPSRKKESHRSSEHVLCESAIIPDGHRCSDSFRDYRATKNMYTKLRFSRLLPQLPGSPCASDLHPILIPLFIP